MAAARVEAKERYLEIAEAIKAEAGVRLHSVCDTLSSRCWAGVRVIEAPEGRTRRQLYILVKHARASPCTAQARKRMRRRMF
jgi:hypothetical protein